MLAELALGHSAAGSLHVEFRRYTMTQDSYRVAVASAVAAARVAGATSFAEILELCEGASPPLVRELLDGGSPSKGVLEFPHKSTHVRQAVSQLLTRLPAPDPEQAQWWFDVDTVTAVAAKVARSCGQGKILCVGAPTVAFALNQLGIRTVVLDIDPDVCAALGTAKRKDVELTTRVHDVRDDIQLKAAPFSGVVLDPPWYRYWTRQFLQLGIPLLETDGHVFLSIPPRLTRASAEQDRADIIASLTQSGMEVVAVERGNLRYVVPRFEQAAYTKIEDFDGRCWRRGDLVHTRLRGRPPSSSHVRDSLSCNVPAGLGGRGPSFSRNPHRFRVFMMDAPSWPTGMPGDREEPTELRQYGKHVGRRGLAEGSPHLWTSEKRGFKLHTKEQFDAVKAVLRSWAEGDSYETALTAAASYTDDEVLAGWTAEHLELWTRFDEQIGRDKAAPLPREVESRYNEREHSSGRDGFREPFQRDRSRLVWTSSLRKLANKTQVFPARDDSELRQRLTHSTEVAQLAGTIARAMGLDPDLTEAGALAHDIGHTPFGHAGEHAIHFVLASINPALFFNHYEHGVDVVRYLEGPYTEHPGHPGLNLTLGVAECIFKHVYSHQNESQDCQPCGPSQPPATLAAMCRYSKHSDYLKPSYGSPEAQAVRLADKISYLISDIEDGIRLGAIDLSSIQECRLFSRAPIDMRSLGGESAAAVFKRNRSVPHLSS